MDVLCGDNLVIHTVLTFVGIFPILYFWIKLWFGYLGKLSYLCYNVNKLRPM